MSIDNSSTPGKQQSKQIKINRNTKEGNNDIYIAVNSLFLRLYCFS